MSYFEYISNIRNFYSYYKYEPINGSTPPIWWEKLFIKKNSYIKVKQFSEKWIPINKDILLSGSFLPFELKGQIYKIYDNEIDIKYIDNTLKYFIKIYDKYIKCFGIMLMFGHHNIRLKKDKQFLITKEPIHNKFIETSFYKKDGFYFYLSNNKEFQFDEKIKMLIFQS